MDLDMGSQTFEDVEVPVLWGTRALLQDKKGRVSVIDLGGSAARLEILADAPAIDVKYALNLDGFTILSDDGAELYTYTPAEKRISDVSLGLPEVEIAADRIRIGTSTFSGNMVRGFGVGIAVTEDGMALGASLPEGLARLAVS
jgi:tricorn protease-like protein